ncbi:hypothetical protein [Methylophaga thalassica]|uniref:hypothetical protein n=1 Tax=Methylophaga thalassica TaxID=40223 RepID=UPI002E7B1268|nr:hypothetical protein [Methylophaga thalassica]WVI84925.1 hypothetical protein VSX76_14240 [Methylophaga thalassica]
MTYILSKKCLFRKEITLDDHELMLEKYFPGCSEPISIMLASATCFSESYYKREMTVDESRALISVLISHILNPLNIPDLKENIDIKMFDLSYEMYRKYAPPQWGGGDIRPHSP